MNVDSTTELHRDSIIIDGCSFFATRWSDRLEKAGVTALQMTVPMTWDGTRDAITAFHSYYDLVEREPRFRIITTTGDIRAAKENGQVGFILGAQSGQFLETDERLVELFQRLGVRVIQLVYNERNLLGDGCLEPHNQGLSPLGRRVVKEMNRVGIQVDLSHVGERTSLEAIELSTKPCIFSHSNPKAVADNPRNITDEQIRRCAEAGGVIGVSPYAPIAWRGNGAPPTMDDVVAHIEYIVDLVGPDHVSVGTDSEATPGAYPALVTRRLAAEYPEPSAPLRERYPDVRKTAGFESMESFPDLVAVLAQRGWSDEHIQGLLGENLIRVYGQNWGEA